MEAAEHVPLAEVKNRLSEVVDRIERSHGRVVITKHGHPSVVLMSLEDLESLEETLSILANPRLVSEIREAEAEIRRGKSKRLSKEHALRIAKRR
jgi:prevent-host-death family protein